MHPVLTCADAAKLEERLLHGDPELEWQAMSRAGLALGRSVLKDYSEVGVWPHHGRLLILAGKGHNAGDAFLAAIEVLRAHPGTLVDVLFSFGEEALNALASRAWQELSKAAPEGAVRSFSLDLNEDVASQLGRTFSHHYCVCLDGIFGMSFRPPFRGRFGEVIQWLNQNLRADLRAAVDLPSGLSDAPSDLALRANFTYMTGSAKQPLFVPENSGWAGRLRYLDIGFFDRTQDEDHPRQVLLPSVLDPLRQLRSAMTHKRKYGHLLIVGGSRATPGAILMSILAAARSGVGLITAAVPESMVPGFVTVVPEAMWIGCPETEEGGLALDSLHRIERVLPKATAVLIGPGVGVEAETQAFLEALVRRVELPLIVDAEALQPGIIEGLRHSGNPRGRVAITPHAGEFSRISRRNFSSEGEEALFDFCRTTGILTLLKGPPFTRLCDGETIQYALAGGPVLARGGSGDLLAGITGSLVARRTNRLEDAVRQAVVWHGLAGEALARASGHEAVRTTELLDFLPRVLREET